jgi:hypothetical protein
MSEDARLKLTDKIGVTGITEIADDEADHGTSVSLDELQRAVDILDSLGWNRVDVQLGPSVEHEEGGQPLLVLKPSPNALLVKDDGDPAVCIAPLTETGRGLSSE